MISALIDGDTIRHILNPWLFRFTFTITNSFNNFTGEEEVRGERDTGDSVV